jgi:hypothetical protein
VPSSSRPRIETSSFVPGFRFTAGIEGQRAVHLAADIDENRVGVTVITVPSTVSPRGPMRLFELGKYVAERVVVRGHLRRVRNVGLGHAGKPEFIYCVIKKRQTP